MDVLDPEVQRRLQLAALFNSGGWSLFENELKEMKDFAILELANLTRMPLMPEELGKVNVAIARRGALDAVFSKIAALKDELEYVENPPAEA